MSGRISTYPIPSPWFAVKGTCDICNNLRKDGSHAKCAKIRQAKFASENAR